MNVSPVKLFFNNVGNFLGTTKGKAAGIAVGVAAISATAALIVGLKNGHQGNNLDKTA